MVNLLGFPVVICFSSFLAVLSEEDTYVFLERLKCNSLRGLISSGSDSVVFIPLDILRHTLEIKGHKTSYIFQESG